MNLRMRIDKMFLLLMDANIVEYFREISSDLTYKMAH